MLAHKYSNYHDKIEWPYFMQRKLNGIRMTYALPHNVGMSRDGHIFDRGVLSHITLALKPLWGSRLILDGELYLHGMSRQNINRRIAVNRVSAHDESNLIEFHVFDCVDPDNLDMPFSQRLSKLVVLLSDVEAPVRLVETLVAAGPATSDSFFRLSLDEGYEGIMYRDPSSPYGLSHRCGNKENRWKYLLKRKELFDEEFEIIGINAGDGKHKGRLGSIICVTKSGKQFNVGTGFSDQDREHFWRYSPVGKQATVSFASLSDDLIPLEPRLDFIHE